MRSRCRRSASSEPELAAALHDLVVARVEHGAGEMRRAGSVGWAGGRSTKAASWRSKASKRAPDRAERARSRCVSASRRGDALHHRRHVLDGLGQEDMQVARRRAFAGQPFGLGRQRAHQPARRRRSRNRPKAARRRRRATRVWWMPIARRLGQHDGAVLQQVGMAFRHDLPQRHIGRGVGGERCEGAMQGRP